MQLWSFQHLRKQWGDTAMMHAIGIVLIALAVALVLHDIYLKD
ncbi:hypothetical protein SJ05684_c10290 [Sinorhizobium sojae CCBAU 05684]|uniref:Uncharacterized protein n=1 Tax=Sinorhizobium sojae CCBAU 05684 TaxID=716928 RepID=A0A249P9W2_9HYPH|nr:hypothetical protein SJ05684_c10290 [Sinorhizobium sojae CCBAU 05684]